MKHIAHRSGFAALRVRAARAIYLLGDPHRNDDGVGE